MNKSLITIITILFISLLFIFSCSQNSSTTGVYLSTDGLQSNPNVIDQTENQFDEIVFAPSNPDIVYAVTKGYLLYKSTDAGNNFSFIINLRDDILNTVP